MDYEVLEGKQEIFEKACNGVIKALQNADGHKRSSLYKDVNRQNVYLIISEWDQMDAFQSFISSDQFRNVTNWGKEQILSRRPTHTVYSPEKK